MDLGLKGRVAFVAGGTAGLGLAVGSALAAEGVAVGLAGRRIDVARREAARFEQGFGVVMDVLNGKSIQDAVAQVEGELGPIDILVLNSGGPPASNVMTLDVDTIRSAGELLLYGPVQLVNACLPTMRSRGWGRIVAIGSTSVQQPISALATSSMFRAAVSSYLKLLAEGVAKEGVTVNMVHPGRIATNRTIEIDSARAAATGMTLEEVQDISEKTIPVGRYGTPEEFGSLVAYLCSDVARYITGEQIRADGGLIRSL
jgi:3-oxoacyl-[acyl-carrier protein] reductase